MLQAIRTRAGGIIVKSLFALLILSFGFWGIYTRSPYFQDKSPDTVIATVGDQSIRADEMQADLQRALERLSQRFGGAIDLQQAKQLGIVDTILRQLVERRLIDEEVRRMQLDVSDDVIRSIISGNPNLRGPDGRFDPAMFQQLLMMNRMTEDQFVARMRRDVPANDLLHAVVAGAAMPQPIADVLYRYRNEKRVADLVAFPLSGITDAGQPSDADLSAFYDAHPDLFRTPEYRGFTLVSLSPADLEKGIEVPEDKLRAEYDQRKDEFETPERRDVQQILAPSKEKAEEAAAALAGGEDWNEVATKIAGMDPDAIDLGLLKRSELPSQLGDIAFEQPLNTPSEPVETPLGWHILRVVKIDPAATQSFDQVKAQLAAELAREDAVDQVYKVANQVDDALAGGASLADVAVKFNLKATEVAAVDVNDQDPEGKPVALPVSAPEVLKIGFGANEGETTRVTETQDNAVFALHVDKLTPPRLKPLDEVKDQAAAAWQREKRSQLAKDKAQALAGAVKPDDPLAVEAAKQGLTVATTSPLGRQPDREAKTPIAPALVAKLFQAKIGDVVTVSDETGAYVAQLKEVQAPEAPAEAAAGLSQELDEAAQPDLGAEYTAALRQRFPVEIKQDVVERMF
ncbi:MAG: SurA N-terminal domain-containing protein [Alphaproteobacteria bacterium]|nr:SurA N-terminal domain-containing protein [Alphaproteobacteria bacterium]